MNETYSKSVLSDLIGFEDEKEMFEYQKEMLSLKFIKVIENFLNQNNVSRKKLANDIDCSQSYISQIFNANKSVNMDFLVKVQNALGLPFDIKLGDYNNDCSSMDIVYNTRHDVLKRKKAYTGYTIYNEIHENNEELLEG